MVCRGAEGDTSPSRFYSRFVQTGRSGGAGRGTSVNLSEQACVFLKVTFFFTHPLMSQLNVGFCPVPVTV